jgi:anti-sigma factor RsiW
MIQDEKHFEILMALAVAGQLSDAELLELEQHATHCSSCVHRKSEMEAASRQLFLLNALKNRLPSTPAGMQERFLMRAIDAGVPLTLPPAGFSYPNVFRSASIAVALLIILSVGWKTVIDRHATVTKAFADAPNAIASAPAISAASIAGRNADSYLAVSRTVKKQHHRPRPSQVQTQLSASISSEGNQADGEHFFTLTPAFFPRNATMIGADYFISSNDSPRKLPMLNISSPTLWNVSE